MERALLNRPTARMVVLLLAAGLTAQAGCSRERYFRQADREARSLVAEKSNDPRWALPGFTVQIDPRSRYYDPYDPVRPPMPPDDPASHRLMHYIDGKKGWPCWHANGDRAALENPYWRERLGEYAGLTEDGAVELSLESAVRLALANSPSYQNQLEEVYLSALDVSTERFRFDVQFFGGNDTTFTHQGRLRDPRFGETNTLTTDTDALLQRQFATAGELLVGFANSFVWQFAGPDTNMTASLINFSLVQPLLRGAGRDVALEQLTIAERTLLANLRAFQRYRQGFFTRVAIGDLGVTGPQRRGGFLGGTGLTGFTGTGSGGFGGVGEATGFGRGAFGGGGAAGGGGAGAGFAGGGAGQVGGFVGLLQQLQQIQNTQESLNLQLRTLRLLEAYFDAGAIDLTQVDQFRQNIETERANLLQATNSLADSLDTYKTGTLGLPPDLPISLDDTLIRQFQFIQLEISNLQNRVSAFMEAFGERPLEPDVEAIRQGIDTVAELQRAGLKNLAVVETDLAELSEHVEARQQGMDAASAEQLGKEMQRLFDAFGELKQRLAATAQSLEKLRDTLTPDTRRQTADQLVEVATELSRVVDELSLVQARARLEKVTIEPIDLTPEEALDIARANRLDWMNNRAALVDTWRLIAFNADRLQSDLDVVFSGDLGTEGNNPVKFRAPTGRLSAGLQFDGPFTRLLERNTFRQVLIDYQRDRRQLIQYEDGVHQTLRSLLRQLKQLELNLEIQRRAVAIAIRRVDQTREELAKPPEAEAGATQFGPTVALNLLYALSDLRSAQNNFMSVWLNYYAARMTLMRELGIMEIDDQGMWVDRHLVSVDRAGVEQAPLPPAVPEGLLDALRRDGSEPVESPVEPLDEARTGSHEALAGTRTGLPSLPIPALSFDLPGEAAVRPTAVIGDSARRQPSTRPPGGTCAGLPNREAVPDPYFNRLPALFEEPGDTLPVVSGLE